MICVHKNGKRNLQRLAAKRFNEAKQVRNLKKKLCNRLDVQNSLTCKNLINEILKIIR